MLCIAQDCETFLSYYILLFYTDIPMVTLHLITTWKSFLCCRCHGWSQHVGNSSSEPHWCLTDIPTGKGGGQTSNAMLHLKCRCKFDVFSISSESTCHPYSLDDAVRILPVKTRELEIFSPIYDFCLLPSKIEYFTLVAVMMETEEACQRFISNFGYCSAII